MMLLPAIFAFLHHLAAFTLVAAVGMELALFSQNLTVAQARKLRVIDAHYGLAALAIVVAGYFRVADFEKGADYYLSNGWFLTKMALFVFVALCSIYPTLMFQSWKQSIRRGEAPVITPERAARVRIFLFLELAGILGILLAAPLMARGFGMLGQPPGG
jgi:putative membrane protein